MGEHDSPPPTAAQGPRAGHTQTIRGHGLRSSRSVTSEKAHCGFTHTVSAWLLAAGGGSESGQRGKAHSPAGNRPVETAIFSCSRRSRLHARRRLRHFRERAGRPALQLYLVTVDSAPVSGFFSYLGRGMVFCLCVGSFLDSTIQNKTLKKKFIGRVRRQS